MKRPRWWQRFRAAVGGYFWLPCPSCGRMFGGHEWENVDDQIANIPVERRVNNGVLVFERGLAICPDCTKAGVGTRAWGLFP